MNIQTLIAELTNDPNGYGYDVMSTDEIIESLQIVDRKIITETFINERTILDAFLDPVDGETVLQTFEAAAQANDVVKRAVKWMSPSEGGIDVGNAVTRGLVDSILIAEHAVVIKALAEKTVSRGEELGIGRVRPFDVEKANRK